MYVELIIHHLPLAFRQELEYKANMAQSAIPKPKDFQPRPEGYSPVEQFMLSQLGSFLGKSLMAASKKERVLFKRAALTRYNDCIELGLTAEANHILSPFKQPTEKTTNGGSELTSEPYKNEDSVPDVAFFEGRPRKESNF